MSDTVLQMVAALSGGTENAVANIDIPTDGTIVGVDWAVNFDLDADGENNVTELSFIATGQQATNDARGVISAVAARVALVTSGVALASINKYVALDIDVAGGERLYLNSAGSAGVSGSVTCLIHFRASRGSPRRSARRR